MSSSAHIYNKRKDILILVKVPTMEVPVMEARVFCLLILQKYINSKQSTQK